MSSKGNHDIYVLFVEKALQLLKEGGIHGYILPHKFFQASVRARGRKLISDSTSVMEIVNFRDNQIFEGASTYTCLQFLSKNKTRNFKYAEIIKLLKPIEQLEKVIASDKYSDEAMRIAWYLKNTYPLHHGDSIWKNHHHLWKNSNSTQFTLEEVTERIFQGLKTSADKIYIMDVKEHKGKLKPFT